MYVGELFEGLGLHVESLLDDIIIIIIIIINAFQYRNIEVTIRGGEGETRVLKVH